MSCGESTLDIGKLRTHKEKVFDKLTGGLSVMVKMRKVMVLRGYGSFLAACRAQEFKNLTDFEFA